MAMFSAFLAASAPECSIELGMAQEFDPAKLSQPDRYKLLIGGIIPRPIAWVSTVSPRGIANLAPFSFFNAIGSDPMLLMFCPANTATGSEKDSLRNAKLEVEGGVGHFVVNMVSHELAAKMSLTAEPLDYEDSEFTLARLTPVKSTRVLPPRIGEAKLAFECVTRQVIRTNPGVANGGNIVIGEVVYIHACDGLVNSRYHVDPVILDAIGRHGGNTYSTTRERFEIPRGVTKPE